MTIRAITGEVAPMNEVCARSWGGPNDWIFCTLNRGHAEGCANSVLGPKPPHLKYFEEQPECAAAIEKMIAEDRKREANKELGNTP